MTDGETNTRQTETELILDRLGNQKKLVPPGKKKVLVICLAGARSLLQPEKKSSSRLSGGCAIIITTGKKSFSRLSGRCAIVLTTGKKKF